MNSSLYRFVRRRLPVAALCAFALPGLAVRCLGELTKEKLDILRKADFIFRDEMSKAKLDRKAQQFFAVMTNVKSVGVRNGARTFGYVIAIRAISTSQFVKAGIGDLIVTCTSVHSRNHSVGERLGKGEKIESILGSMQMVAEGVWNSKVVHEIARRLGVDMPICELVYALCYKGFDAKQASAAMMSRSLKAE